MADAAQVLREVGRAQDAVQRWIRAPLLTELERNTRSLRDHGYIDEELRDLRDLRERDIPGPSAWRTGAGSAVASVRVRVTCSYVWRGDHRCLEWGYGFALSSQKDRKENDDLRALKLLGWLARERRRLEVTLCSPELPQELLDLVADFTELAEHAETEAICEALELAAV
jgi:hypothetical protein